MTSISSEHAKKIEASLMPAPWRPFLRYYKRNSGRVMFRKLQRVNPRHPIVSFTFDDFPHSALLNGGKILKSFGAEGTYYASLGLLGKGSPSGEICSLNDLENALAAGHELGCHTFSHCDSWTTEAAEFERAIVQNRLALQQLLPDADFGSFSFPRSSPHPAVKRVAARHFSCSRGGGQTLNLGTADLNQLSAYFLEKAAGNAEPVKALIDKNRESRGWLIFATHDVSPDPSPYGCTPRFFEEIVSYASASGARIVPVIKGLELVQER